MWEQMAVLIGGARKIAQEKNLPEPEAVYIHPRTEIDLRAVAYPGRADVLSAIFGLLVVIDPKVEPGAIGIKADLTNRPGHGI